jgi:hypothetical protein
LATSAAIRANAAGSPARDAVLEEAAKCQFSRHPPRSHPMKENRAMSGIQFVTDEKGRKVAVQIDLKK